MQENTTVKLCSGSFESVFEGFIPLQVPRRVNSSWITHVPFAFWLTEAAAPEMLVELGTYSGVSFCAFCQQIEKSGLPTQCYAVDSWEGDAHISYHGQPVYDDLLRHIHEHYGSFAHLIRSTFDEALPLFNDGSIDVLHIDGCHSYEAIMHDFEAWLPKMSARGVILMHDINARIAGYGGLQAWGEISARFPTFSFAHGYGLGVVLTGDVPPEKLRLLVECGHDSAFLEKTQRYFSLLGAMQQRLQDLLVSLDEERRVLHELRGQKEEAACAAQRERDHMQRLILQEIENYEALLRAYAGSASWKCTRPFRAAANLYRRLCGKPELPELPTHISPPAFINHEAGHERS